MMGVYIKDMKMPTRCWDCLLNTYGYCMASDKHSDIIPSDAPIPEWCPLVPVPPHGDLIDRDALDKAFTELRWDDNGLAHWGDRKDWCLHGSEIEALISAAPTIIPASESVKTEEDSEPWLCLSCRNYPPSSTDGKPCTQCDPCEVLHSCYDPAEEGE